MAKVTEYGSGKNLRWKVTAANGHKIANGGQGYSRDIDRDRGMIEAAKAILEHFAKGRKR